MIPGIIHAGTFGPYKDNDLNRRCYFSWGKAMPEAKLMLWGDSAAESFPEVYRSLPIFRSNYFKYWVLWNYGGIYMDNDVELVRPIDLDCGAFFGFQRSDQTKESINTAIIGAVPKHPVIGQILKALDGSTESIPCPIWMGCGLPTDTLYAAGMKGLDEAQMVSDVRIYDHTAFYPWRWDETPPSRLLNSATIGIHQWGASWLKKSST